MELKQEHGFVKKQLKDSEEEWNKYLRMYEDKRRTMDDFRTSTRLKLIQVEKERDDYVQKYTITE